MDLLQPGTATPDELIANGQHPETGEVLKRGAKGLRHALAIWPANIPNEARAAEARRRIKLITDFYAALNKPAAPATK